MTQKNAVNHALEMIKDGADIIDVGGESTRPGSKPVDAAEQIRRVVPVIRDLSEHVCVPISIDTTSAEVALAAVAAGASIINDISALRSDEQIAEVAARTKAAVIIMHMQGTPADMQKNPTYLDVVQEVKAFLETRIKYARQRGIEAERIIIDPGMGFGKSVEHNLLLLRDIESFHALGVPLMVGPSRKAFIGKILQIENPQERVMGTAAAAIWCITKGVQFLRIHDVREINQVRKILQAIQQSLSHP